MGTTVVVASDGSALADHRTHVEPMLRRYAAVIEDLAGLSVRVLPLGTGDRVLTELPSEVGVVFLPHVRSELACAARSCGVPVVTDQDTTAIALTAAVLTSLSRSGRRPVSGKVVIVGADAVPILCPLLMVAGIGEITVWNPADAIIFPLRRVVGGADVVVDLLGATASLGTDQPDVVLPETARDPLLALPGLLRALGRVVGARLDVEVHHACALALVMATRPDELLPARADGALTDRVADAATQALHQLAHRPSDTRG